MFVHTMTSVHTVTVLRDRTGKRKGVCIMKEMKEFGGGGSKTMFGWLAVGILGKELKL